MTKNRPSNPQRDVILNTIGAEYIELKGKRNALMQEYMKQVEHDMEAARENFGSKLQQAYESEFDISVADLMRAMGTTSRNTVNDYLKDARERKALSKLPVATTLPYELYGVWSSTQGNPAFTTTWAIVFDGENTWDVTFDEARYSVFVAVPDETKPEGYGRTGSEKKFSKKLDNDAPEWLTWLVQQDEWKENL